jgi:uncharacterized membrane protein
MMMVETSCWWRCRAHEHCLQVYLQWTLFAVCAGAALSWLLHDLPEWSPNWRRAWQVTLAALVAGAALYPLMAGMAKIKDRMAPDIPLTLDGMEYMQHAYFTDDWGTMDLSQDYRAIRWLQENVQGSPVIAEANLRALYRWGSRYTINTGLPSVVGWEWHQQQQRAVNPGTWVTERIAEVDDFYLTTDETAGFSARTMYPAMLDSRSAATLLAPAWTNSGSRGQSWKVTGTEGGSTRCWSRERSVLCHPLVLTMPWSAG